MILGLDISTSCTGWCIIDSIDSRLLKMGHIELSREKKFLTKAEIVKESLVCISREWDIKTIFIEENLQAFRPGFSSAKTLMTLARFNGIVSYICCRDIGIEPQFEWVKNRVEVDWPMKVLKSGPRKGLSIFSPGCYDMADAYVIASAGYNMIK